MASEVERVVLSYPGVALAKVSPKNNPITGQHVELLVQPSSNSLIDKDALLIFLRKNLQEHMIPRRVTINQVDIGHRFKKK